MKYSLISVLQFILLLHYYIHESLALAFSSRNFNGLSVVKVSESVEKKVDFGEHLQTLKGNTLVILGTYAADFNAIEYGQRLRYYIPKLKEKGISNYVMILNASPSATKSFAKIIGLPNDVQMVSDPVGACGKNFGCSRGWRPDDLSNPYFKLFGMLWGLGAWATLPSVIGGYTCLLYTSPSPRDS